MKEVSPLEAALQFAAKMHTGQCRDGLPEMPYALHPFEVVTNLRYVGRVVDEEILVAAALHDLLEETTVKESEICERFGRGAAALVREMTRHEPKKRETLGLSTEEVWQLRSEMLLTEIATMSREAKTIKLADRLSNLSAALVTRTGEKLERYKVQSYEILETIPRETNPELWDAIRNLLATGGRPEYDLSGERTE